MIKIVVMCLSRLAAVLTVVTGCYVVYFDRYNIDIKPYENSLGLILVACGLLQLGVTSYYLSTGRVAETMYESMLRVIEVQKRLTDMQLIELSRCRGIIDGFNIRTIRDTESPHDTPANASDENGNANDEEIPF